MHRNGKTPGGKTRWMCRERRGDRNACYSSTNPAAAVGVLTRSGRDGKSPVFKRKLREKTKVYVITNAQNATPEHPVFWPCLKTLAKHRKAELLVVPGRYKNPTSRWSESQANAEWWVPAVTPFLWNVRRKLNDNLTLLADIKAQPTDSDPVSGFDSITGAASAIVGHPKLQMKCVPAPANKMAKVLTTTGSCTIKNYTDSKVGKKAAFHHTYGAVIVKVRGNRFHLRHVNFDEKTGSFTDLKTRYYPDRCERAPRPLALITGDTHVDFMSKLVKKATYGKGGMVEVLEPWNLVHHDLLDNYSVNPHHKGRPFIAIAKYKSGRDDVLGETRRACQFVRAITKGDMKSVVVASNHDDFLRRWVETHDWKSDPKNASFYLKLAKDMVDGTEMTSQGTYCPDPLAIAFPEFVDMTNIRLLKVDEPFVLGGVVLNMHGDRGPKGTRGSRRNLRRIGAKLIIGHSHSPGIEEGCTQVGTSTELRAEYTLGPGDWMNTHCILQADGKRQLVSIIGGDWGNW